MFYMYIATGRRNAEVRLLKWGEIIDDGQNIYYEWSNKGKYNQRAKMPRSIYNAILEYLRIAGRLDNIQKSDYIFTALNENCKRLWNNGQVVSSDWKAGHYPLAGHTVNDLLKKYAKYAGIDPKKLHVHCLRHTKAMLHLSAGSDIVQISKILGHEQINTTQIYVEHLRAVENDGWEEIEKSLGIGE